MKYKFDRENWPVGVHYAIGSNSDPAYIQHYPVEFWDELKEAQHKAWDASGGRPTLEDLFCCIENEELSERICAECELLEVSEEKETPFKIWALCNLVDFERPVAPC